MRRSGKTAIGIAAALLLLGGGAAWRRPAADARVDLVLATRGTVEQAVSATGAVRPKTFVDVGTQVSGQLRHIHVKIGDRVEKGQLLAEIDPTVYQTRVAAARARIKDLEAQRREMCATRDLAELRFRRQDRLAATAAASREALDGARADYLVAEARIAALAARVEETRATLAGDEANLGYTRIFAPIAGTVVAIPATEGQTLNASQTAPTILRIADLETMTVWAEVAEADVPRLAVGMPARFATLGGARTWRGAVRQILPTPEVENDVVLYSVLVDVDNPDGALMSEMTAHVFFVERAVENAVTVPRGVLAGAGADGLWTVRLKTDAGLEDRTVRTGLVTRTRAEVVEGLRPGDAVARVAAPKGGK